MIDLSHFTVPFIKVEEVPINLPNELTVLFRHGYPCFVYSEQQACNFTIVTLPSRIISESDESNSNLLRELCLIIDDDVYVLIIVQNELDLFVLSPTEWQNLDVTLKHQKSFSVEGRGEFSVGTEGQYSPLVGPKSIGMSIKWICEDGHEPPFYRYQVGIDVPPCSCGKPRLQISVDTAAQMNTPAATPASASQAQALLRTKNRNLFVWLKDQFRRP